MQLDRRLDPCRCGVRAAAVTLAVREQRTSRPASEVRSTRRSSGTARVGRGGLPEGRRDPVRLRAAPSLGRRGGAGWRAASTDHQGRPRRRSSTVCTTFEAGGRRRAARRGDRGEPSLDVYERAERGGLACWRSRTGGWSRAGRLPRERRDRPRAGRLRQLSPTRCCADAADGHRGARRDGVTVKILTGDNELVARTSASRSASTQRRSSPATRSTRTDDAALGARRRAGDGVRARLAGAEEPDHPRAEAPRPRRRVPGRRHQRRALAPRGRRRHLGDDGRGRRARRGRHHPASSRSLRVLHRGILEGRRAFGNVMKYLLMGTSSNFGNMFSMAAASVFLPFLPMLPTQILLNNFLYDLAQITIPTDNVDRAYLPPPAALGHRPHPRLHDLHRAGQLGLRLPDVLRAAARLPRRASRCSTRAGSSSRWRRRRSCCSSSARWETHSGAGRAGG